MVSVTPQDYELSQEPQESQNQNHEVCSKSRPASSVISPFLAVFRSSVQAVIANF